MTNLSYVISYYEIHRNFPPGSRDKAGRWYPSEKEKCSCCEKIRDPSREWPWSLYKHCMTKRHIKQLILEKMSDDAEVQAALNLTPEKALEHINDNEDNLIGYTAKRILLNLKKETVTCGK